MANELLFNFTGRYTITKLPTGRQLMVWRIMVFPDLGPYIEWRVFKKVVGGYMHWTVTRDHEDFQGATTFEEFVQKNSLEDAVWEEIERDVEVDV